MNQRAAKREVQNEVRPYLIRLVSIILCGVVLMATVATWAYRTYGAKLDTAPPLPDGTPPFSSSPSR